MAITRIKLERFTAFRQLDFVPSPGINVIVGANGTGKTHLMKVAYAACDVSKTRAPFAQKLVRLFLPSGRSLGRLVRRQQGSSRCSVEVYRDGTKLRASFSNHATAPDSASITGAGTWSSDPVRSVYVPVKEMLANSPGFRSLYSQREIHFEEIYSDILDRAHLPVPRGAPGRERGRLLNALQKTIAGKVTVKDEEFFLRNKQRQPGIHTALGGNAEAWSALAPNPERNAPSRFDPLLGRAGDEPQPEALRAAHRHSRPASAVGNPNLHRHASQAERWLPWAGMPPDPSGASRGSRFQVMKVVLRLVKSFCGPPEPSSR